ncbi:hypothetical protein SeLEV6574_g01124 [Synchytrium endobioticum]|nr:hypothetical protein SeLEV6574_g01124 [Synchytrium endobioticum]
MHACARAGAGAGACAAMSASPALDHSFPVADLSRSSSRSDTTASSNRRSLSFDADRPQQNDVPHHARTCKSTSHHESTVHHPALMLPPFSPIDLSAALLQAQHDELYKGVFESSAPYAQDILPPTLSTTDVPPASEPPPPSPNSLQRRTAMARRKRMTLPVDMISMSSSVDEPPPPTSDSGHERPATAHETFPTTLLRARSYSPATGTELLSSCLHDVSRRTSFDSFGHDILQDPRLEYTPMKRSPNPPRRSVSVPSRPPIRPPVSLPRPPSVYTKDDYPPDLYTEPPTWTTSSPIMHSTSSSVTAVESTPPTKNRGMSDEESTAVKRAMASRELLETERGYVNDLTHLVEDCFERLLVVSWLTYPEKLQVVKCGRLLLDVQSRFLHSLESAFTESENSDNGQVAVANIFMCAAKSFDVYKQYCTEYDGTLQLLSSYANTLELYAFTNEFRALAQTRLGIRDYLIKPIQRICKYPTLLSELLRLTPTASPEYSLLILARVTMQSIAAEVDTARRLIENSQRSERLIRRLVTDASLYIPRPSEVSFPGESIGIMSKGGGLWVAFRNEKDAVTEVKYRGVFAFPKHLLIMKAKKASVYHLKALLRLEEYELRRVSNQDPTSIAPYAFRLHHLDLNVHYDFGCSSERERTAWISALQGLCNTSSNSTTRQSFWHHRRRTVSSSATEVSSEPTDLENDSAAGSIRGSTAAGSTRGSIGVGMERSPSALSLASMYMSDRSSPLPPASPVSPVDTTAPSHGVFGANHKDVNSTRRFWRTSSLNLNDPLQNPVFNRRASIDLKLSDVITTYAAADSLSGAAAGSATSASVVPSYPSPPVPRTRSFTGRYEVKSMPDFKYQESMSPLLPIASPPSPTPDAAKMASPTAMHQPITLASVVTSPISVTSPTRQLDYLTANYAPVVPVPPPKPLRPQSRISSLSLVTPPQLTRDARRSSFTRADRDYHGDRTEVSSHRFSFLRTMTSSSNSFDYGDHVAVYNVERRTSRSVGNNTLSRIRNFLKTSNNRTIGNAWKDT